jgi:hypothetical protein
LPELAGSIETKKLDSLNIQGRGEETQDGSMYALMNMTSSLLDRGSPTMRPPRANLSIGQVVYALCLKTEAPRI